MFCSNCGAPIPDGANFCASCGSRVNGAENKSEEVFGQQQFSRSAAPAPGSYKANVKFRNIATCVVLSIITCGIYAIVWSVCIVDDLNFASGRNNDTNGITVFLLGLLTCGIYTLYWLYTSGEKVAEIKKRNGEAAPASSDGAVYLVLGIFGFSIVSYCLIQNEINKIAALQ